MSDSRITKTNTGKYDQIFALPQAYLNQCLEELFKSNKDLHTLDNKNILGKIVAAPVGPPEVALDVTSGENFAKFYINLLGGHLFLRDIDTGDDVAGMPADGWPLQGCRIAFRVAIGLEDIKPTDPMKGDAWKHIHEDADDYSLNRLYLDLTNADLSSFLAGDSKLPEGVLESNGNFIKFFDTWMLQAHKKNVNTLGYSLDAKKAQSNSQLVAPTFMPYYNNFQTYAWHNDSGKLEDGPKNALLYCQLAGSTQRDPPQPTYYNYTGNMVRSDDRGSLMISRVLFWDEWLLPKLRELNIVTLLVATGAHCSNNEVSPDWEFYWKAGRDIGRKDDDLFYDWKPSDNGWQFSDHTHADDSGGIWGSKLHCYIDCVVTNTIQFSPGVGEIKVSGTTHCTIERDTTASGTAHGESWINWNFTLLMSAIEDPKSINYGGLQLTLASSDFPAVQQKGDSAPGTTSSVPDGANNAVGSMLGQVEDKIKGWVKELANDLAGAQRLVLPGTGTFSTENPVFNNDRDWMCDIKYLPSQLSLNGA